MTDSATIDDGDSINFDVRINSSSTTAVDTHNVDVEYTKQRVEFMQNFSTAKCDNMSIYSLPGSELDLVDARDAKTYKIRKLDDNKCWMVDNLALQGPMTLDAQTSDRTTGTYALPVVATPNSETYCANLDQAIYPHRCGNHYNWTVAAAGSISSVAQTAAISICPKNWRLPTYTMYNSLRTDSSWGTSGNNVIISGWQGLYAGQNTSNNVGVYGYYWTASTTDNGDSYAYTLIFSDSSVVMGSSGHSKTNQRSVRCLAR
jgi:uncharacterized protein (TIGR02145 family)